MIPAICSLAAKSACDSRFFNRASRILFPLMFFRPL
nr:MAG TPA: hypothetical protein [Caudoviricetes sp.]